MSASTLLLFNLAREFFTDSLIACFYAAFGHFILGIRQRPKYVALACAINILSHALSRHLVFTTLFSYLITALDLFLICRVLWQPRRGIAFWRPFLLCTVAMILNEIVISAIYLLIYPNAGTTVDIAGSAQYALLPHTYPALFALTVGYMCAILLLMYWSRKLILYANERNWDILRILRFCMVVVLLFIVLAMFGLDFDHILVTHTDTAFQIATLEGKLSAYILYFVLAIFLCSYAWQDIRQFALSRDNQSLNERNAAYQRVIDSTREYRHNMANLLYGLEGVILTRDIAEIQSYYNEVAYRCARINNENAIAINRLKNPALVALLLRKADEAQRKSVPFYLSVSDSFSFDFLPCATLCETLGILMDNALEAAERSSAPRVDMTMRSAPEYDEIIIANTYAEDTNMDFLSGTPRSSKPGHRATGLAFVRKMLSRHPSVCFNQFVRGRYVETSLCAYKH